MKKVLLFGAFMAMLGVSAHAVQKCVALDTENMEPVGWDVSGGVDWWVDFDNGVKVVGMGVCSNQGSSYGTVSPTISISPVVDENVHCWCRMISPAISAWVYHFDDGYSYDCVNDCSAYCGEVVGESYDSAPRIRDQMFSNLIIHI